MLKTIRSNLNNLFLIVLHVVYANKTGCFLPFVKTGRRLFEEVPFYKAIIIKIILHDMVPSNANVSPIFRQRVSAKMSRNGCCSNME